MFGCDSPNPHVTAKAERGHESEPPRLSFNVCVHNLVPTAKFQGFFFFSIFFPYRKVEFRRGSDGSFISALASLFNSKVA